MFTERYGQQEEFAEALGMEPVRFFCQLGLTQSEVTKAFNLAGNTYDPILSLVEAARLAKIAPSTLKRLVSEGQYKNSVKRGKPLRFWRDRFVQEVMG